MHLGTFSSQQKFHIGKIKPYVLPKQESFQKLEDVFSETQNPMRDSKPLVIYVEYFDVH